MCTRTESKCHTPLLDVTRTRCTGSTSHNGSPTSCACWRRPYKCLHGFAPDYLTRLCVRVATVHGRHRLRSSDDHQLLIPRTRTVTLGPCTFNTSRPASWNVLPAALRDLAVTMGTFRQMLKSFLFWLTDVYRPWYSCRSTRLCDVC